MDWGIIFSLLAIANCCGWAFYMWRLAWYQTQRKLWVYLAHEYNMAMIERTAAHDVFLLKGVTSYNLANYDALGAYGHGMFNVFNWKLEGLAVDRERFEMVMKFHQERRAGAN